MKKVNLIFVIAFVAMFFLVPFLGGVRGGLYAQVGINTTGNNPDPSAMLDVNADGATKGGLLIPRMTTAERNSISNPANSLLIFNTTTQCF
jgi:hypothetical protein